jgi:hypothetical protein
MLLAKGLRKTFLLVLSFYLLSSVVLVYFDQHPIAPSQTCTLCFLKKSLSSAINQSPVLQETDRFNVNQFAISEGSHLEGLDCFSCKPYRGPPFPSLSS